MSRPKPEPLTDRDREYAAELLDFSASVCPDPDCLSCKMREAQKAQQLNEQKHDVQLEISRDANQVMWQTDNDSNRRIIYGDKS